MINAPVYLRIAVLCVGLDQAQPQADSRQPVPAPASQKEAERLIRDIFKDEYSKKGLPDRLALAKKLLAQAREAKDDPVTRYVLLREARGLGADVGDSDTALGALDDLLAGYRVDGPTLRLATLSTLALMAKTPPEWKAWSVALLKLAEDSAGEEFDVAEKSANAALQLATRSKDLALVTRAQSSAKEAGEMKALRDRIKKATEDLAANPEDAGANLAVGHFKCLLLGKWDEGLPLLAKGKDDALRALAASDLAARADPATQVAVGDAWWAWSEKESGPIRLNARRRAGHWYVSGLAGTGGLVKLRLEKRIAELGIPTELDLLGLVDLGRDLVRGDWSFDGKTLVCNRILAPSIVQIPYEPPDEYDLTLVVERLEATAALYIGLAREATQFYVGVDDHGGALTGIGKVDGKITKDNETAVLGLLLSNNKPATIVCSIRRDEVGITVDGRRIITYKGGYGRLTNMESLVVPNRRAIFVGCGNARYSFSKISLLRVSGQGKPAAEPRNK